MSDRHEHDGRVDIALLLGRGWTCPKSAGAPRWTLRIWRSMWKSPLR
ncbi:MAG TPA: hypothetical protein VF069_15500 [Streptosporangiaceae bacterium]